MKNQPLLKLRGDIAPQQSIVWGTAAILLWITSWWLVSVTGWISPKVAPSPFAVLGTIPEMYLHHKLTANILYSLAENLTGTIIAIAISLPVGLLLGLVPVIRAMSKPFFIGLRFVPLPVAIPIFMAAFGIGFVMKSAFLMVSIAIYLIPTVMQRVSETPQVYIDTANTLGANYWQLVRHVFVPDVFSRAWDDIVILIGLSWTYISFVDLINMSDGGLGAMIYAGQRTSTAERYYAVLLVIMFVAYIEAMAFEQAGFMFFPFKKKGR